MQQFTVPQFIDVEDKIIGPITARQFIIILAGSLVLFICYSLMSLGGFIAAVLIVGSLCALFGFVKINGMPFHYFLLNFVQTTYRPNLRLWDNDLGRLESEASDGSIIEKKEIQAPQNANIFTSTRLAELSLIVDTQGAYMTGRGGMTDFKLKNQFK